MKLLNQKGILGFIYILNSGEGVKIDYLILNITGYSALCVYSTAGYFNHNLDIGVVDLEDLVFAYHGFLMTSLMIFLVLYYPRQQNLLSQVTIIIVAVIWTTATIYTIITLVIILLYLMKKGFKWYIPPENLNAYKIMGYDKLIITLIKYIPQVYYNHTRKSTVGWNIVATLADLGGGILSFIQSILDRFNPCILKHFIYFQANQIEINTVKFLLGLITIFFDLILMIQHYCLYPKKKQAVYLDASYQSLQDDKQKTNATDSDVSFENKIQQENKLN